MESHIGIRINLGDYLYKVSFYRISETRSKWLALQRFVHVRVKSGSGEATYMLLALNFLHVLLLVREKCSFVSTLKDDSFF